jgi:chaperonin GroES
MKKILPLGDRVLVKREKAQKTKGAILLPDTAQEKPKEGTVVSVGPGKVNDQGQTEPMNIKVGDRVLFSAYSGTEIKINDEDELILSKEDILGILN